MVCLDWKTVILAPIEKCNTVESNSLDFHPRRPGTAGAENITKLGSLIFKIMCVAFSCALRIECNSQMWNWAIYEKCFHLWWIVSIMQIHIMVGRLRPSWLEVVRLWWYAPLWYNQILSYIFTMPGRQIVVYVINLARPQIMIFFFWFLLVSFGGLSYWCIHLPRYIASSTRPLTWLILRLRQVTEVMLTADLDCTY